MNIFTRVFWKLYSKMIVNKKHEISFWVLYAFLFTFGLVRVFVYLFPGFSFFKVVEETVHVHHFVPGFFILSIAGFLALNDFHHRKPRMMGLIFGFGLALAFDEFALWLYLDDIYWARRSYDVIVIIAGLLISYLYFGNFWNKVFSKIMLILRKIFKKKIKELT